MGLLSLFTRKRDAEPSAEWRPLTVLCAIARDGLAAEDGFALRDIIIAGGPIDFQFLNPSTFLVFFPGSVEGDEQAERLSSELKAFAQRAGLSAFGVGFERGPCLVSQADSGQFAAPPSGDTVSRAMHAAIAGAANALSQGSHLK